LGVLLNAFPDLDAQDSQPGLYETKNSQLVKEIMCRKCGALPFQIDNVENTTNNTKWTAFRTQKSKNESVRKGLKYECGVCRNKIEISDCSGPKRDLFFSINTDLGTHDIKVGQSKDSEQGRTVGLLFDVSEPNDIDDMKVRCEKFFDMLADAFSELSETDDSTKFILFISFKRNLFVLSDERMMDLTEFTMFNQEGGDEFCHGYDEKGSDKKTFFKLLTGEQPSKLLNNHNLINPPNIHDTHSITKLTETTISKLKTNFQELLQYKLTGNSIKNWGDKLTNNSKLNQIFTISKIMAMAKTTLKQILMFNCTYSLSFDYGTGDSGILEKDETISDIVNFMRQNTIWLDALVLERGHMVDILKLVEPLGGRVAHLSDFFSRNDPNTLSKFTKNIEILLQEEVYSNVQIRVITPE
jgi:hypothetical protein